MKRIKCIVIDDEAAARNRLKGMISNIPVLDLVLTTDDPLKVLDKVEDYKVELVFVDVEMPTMDGLELIRKLEGRAQVICCSGHSQFGDALYELDVSYYLVKPFTRERFEAAVARAFERLDFGEWAARNFVKQKYDPAEPFIFNDTNRNMVLIEIGEIDYFQADDHTINIYHHGGKQTAVTGTLTDFAKRLPSAHFMRVGKSFIVALNRIWRYNIREHTLTLKELCSCKNDIPIGKIYREQVRCYFSQQVK
ncbi:MAG: LytR/AlgR family response regulator transcription factor [Sphingobacterium sp.]